MILVANVFADGGGNLGVKQLDEFTGYIFSGVVEGGRGKPPD